MRKESQKIDYNLREALIQRSRQGKLRSRDAKRKRRKSVTSGKAVSVLRQRTLSLVDTPCSEEDGMTGDVEGEGIADHRRR